MIQYKEQLIQFFKFNHRTMADSARPVPELENPIQLRDPKIVAQFEALVYEVVQDDEGEIAFLGRRLMEDLLLPQDPQMKQVASPIFQRYQRLIQILKFVNLSTYAMPEILELVRTRLADVVSLGCPVVNRFQRVADAYDTVNPAGTVPQNLINAVMACEQRLGSRPIMVSGKPVAPTVGNWIKDFVAFSANSAEGNSGSLQRVRYFESTANAKSLSNDEEATLLRIFRIYNWLLLGDESSEDFSEEFISNLQSKTQLDKPLPAQSISSNLANTVPREGIARINDIKPEKKMTAQFRPEPLTQATDSISKMQMSQTLGSSGDGVNVQDVLFRDNSAGARRGLDLENTSPIPVPKPIIKQETGLRAKGLGLSEKSEKGKDIDDKLAKLKARTGKK